MRSGKLLYHSSTPAPNLVIGQHQCTHLHSASLPCSGKPISGFILCITLDWFSWHLLCPVVDFYVGLYFTNGIHCCPAANLCTLVLRQDILCAITHFVLTLDMDGVRTKCGWQGFEQKRPRMEESVSCCSSAYLYPSLILVQACAIVFNCICVLSTQE